jgi:hypothetical protein
LTPSDQAAFVRDFIKDYLEVQLQTRQILLEDFWGLESSLEGPEFESRCKQLFASSPKPVEFAGIGPLRIVYLSEANGDKFPFLQGFSSPPSATPSRGRTCFVGFRFLPAINKAIRRNLSTLLAPYQMEPIIVGDDLSAKKLFDAIVDRIASADMCIFDTLGTKDRPNVFVEIGIAHARGKPFIVCEYTGGSDIKGKAVPETGKFPSDLEFLVRVQYASYEELCRQLYFRLPDFLRANKLLGAP